MTKAVLAAGILVFEIHPARLEILEIRAAGHFQITPLPGCPYFDVVGLCCTEAKIAGTEFDGLVVQSKDLQHLLGIYGQCLQLRIGSFRCRDLNQLDLIELVYANETAALFSGGSSLPSKTRGIGHIFLR